MPIVHIFTFVVVVVVVAVAAVVVWKTLQLVFVRILKRIRLTSLRFVKYNYVVNEGEVGKRKIQKEQQ